MHKIMDPAKADELREKFIEAFVDTSTERYKELAKVKPADTVYDSCVVRYMYDTLYWDRTTVVPFSRALQTVAEKNRVYSLWDIHPTVIHIKYPSLNGPKPHYLELYKTDTVIEWDADELAALLEKELGDYKTTDYLHNSLPEDIYIFDDSFQWCVIFTHSPTREDYEERACVICNRRAAPDPEA